MSAPVIPREFRVDPARLAMGTWCQSSDRQIGEGDIYASYSADKIGMNQPIRKPFRWKNGLWVCTAIKSISGERSLEAYRLISAENFDGGPETYREVTINNAARRQSGMGFYHGMLVSHASKKVVLLGPPVMFLADHKEQLEFF